MIDLRIIGKDLRIFRRIRHLLQNLVNGLRRLQKAGEVHFMVCLFQKALKGFRSVLRGAPVFTKQLLHPGRIRSGGGTLCLLGISGDHDYQLVSSFQGTVCLTIGQIRRTCFPQG